MIRKGFRTRLQRLVPSHYHGVVYTVASGAVLLALVLLWQESPRVLVELRGATKWLLRCLIPLALWIFVSGVRALGSFDAFGISPVIARVRGKHERRLPFAARGAYRWVRHPQYLAMLMVMWSYPVITTDRLLFNALWSAWVLAGTVFEERDLVADFGATYRDYQKKVPMIIPWKIPGPPSAIDAQ
jgi:protein-S-isoprenylcysteine O-methyltransferase Ste14